MSKKVFGELEEKVRKLVLEGYSANYISLQTDLCGDTIFSWCKRNNLTTGHYRNPEYKEKELKFIELMKSGLIIKQASIIVGVDCSTGKRWAQINGFEKIIRNRTQAGVDKRFSLEEVDSKLPLGHGKASHYDSETKSYVIKRTDGSTYNRIASQIFRGDPKLSEKRRDTEDEVAIKLLEIGYKLIPGSYTLKNNSLQAEHIVCGYVRENDFKMIFKQNCPRCSNIGISREEMEVNDYIKSLGFETNKFRFLKDYEGRGKGKEIDIFIKNMNFGIEYCGLHFHGELSKSRSTKNKLKRHENKNKKYEKTNFDSPQLFHKAKLEKAKFIGIQLITLFSNEWKHDKNKVKALLKAKLGKNEIKLQARDLEIKELTKEEVETFMNAYHLQGYAASAIAYGLFDKDNVVAAISGNHHHMGNGEFVLNRLCFKENISVTGGSGKLMKALENWTKDNGFSEIKTWSDNRWSDGNVYKATGYELKSELAPSYFYFDSSGKTYSRHNLTKEKLQELGGVGDTEWEMAQSLGYDRIWDCGKKTWVKKLT